MEKTKNNSFFDDMMQSLQEVEEHQKGNIKLKSNIVTIDDDFIIKYNQLSIDNQQTVKILIDRLLLTNNSISVIK